VVKLCYLGGREFLFLKELRDRFVAGLLGEGKGPGKAKQSRAFENHHFISPIRNVLNQGRDNPSPGYEATPIWNTRHSLFWSWRRAAEYFRDLFEMDRTREVYELMAN
jgi:hypothetical protein